MEWEMVNYQHYSRGAPASPSRYYKNNDQAPGSMLRNSNCVM